MPIDSSGLQVLSREECLGLLASTPIGRIVFTDRALPAVQPVTFRLDGERVVIRTAAGSKLAAATRQAVVAFEVDEFDPEERTGWSVTAVGHARAVCDPDEIERLAALPLTAWAPGERDHFIVVDVEQVTGRQIRSARSNGARSPRTRES
ncbi:pyridoxamine 5'-phosphate oxidase family protein [Nonomuraea muscovyensis]|uniref:Nitroimidazol reductase NimA-like FMN-containing flavoprotein (Pyridoxamine 5'-phosphate oxidase superfamily) n=1 Tax=Nonomuraea muscovyensis TaxID=1124761 RepID=A0A7X0C9A0_9ACTN|nr:pyridoxamine 5'-phosphate oxidase family protein [Nonomuraea muscovyensis]MBB6349064.1 nitroimidazol reductase NimA-like FMN-containing flavoprotein (pyridoxamine 5'-phosphate oxidase superfamily) [Nonomuraea muscovyensis]